MANTLITHHFGTREALLEAAMEWATQQTPDLIDMASDATFDEQFAVEFVAKIAGEPQLQFFQYEMVLAARHQPQMRATVDRLYGHYMDAIALGFARRGFPQPDLLARVFFAATDGLVMQQLTFFQKGRDLAGVYPSGAGAPSSAPDNPSPSGSTGDALRSSCLGSTRVPRSPRHSLPKSREVTVRGKVIRLRNVVEFRFAI